MSKANGVRIVLPILLVAITLLAVSATVSTAADCDARVGKYTTIEKVAATHDGQGFAVEGELSRMRFSPRRQLTGSVVVAVQAPDGTILARATLTTRPGFVPKGLRTARFAGRVDGHFPPGSRLILQPVS